MSEYNSKGCVLLREMREKMTTCMMSEIEAGFDSVETEEAGAVVDMIKDLAEAEEKIVKSAYYKQIMDAMINSEYGKDYDEGGVLVDRGVYNDRDMDLRSNRMYYTEGWETHNPRTTRTAYREDTGSLSSIERDPREGRAWRSRVRYYTTKEEHSSDAEGDKMMRINALEEMLEDTSKDLKEAIAGATPEERTMMRTKLMNIANAII